MTPTLWAIAVILSAIISSALTWAAFVPALKRRVAALESEVTHWTEMYNTAWEDVIGLAEKLADANTKLAAFEADNLPDRDEVTGRFAKRKAVS